MQNFSDENHPYYSLTKTAEKTNKHRWKFIDFFLISISIIFASGCGPSDPQVEEKWIVVYTSQDQVYAEKIFNAFTASTGIEVKAQYDNESAKTMGLAKRLVAEQIHPVCDVFWSNEAMAARKLSEAGVVLGFEEFGHRARVLIVNTNHISLADAPKSIKDLTSPTWKGKIAMAYPLFGTTATHILALKEEWGPEIWKDWCEGLVANQTKIVDGNSMVVRLVGAGEAWVGLTDSDDLAVGLSKGLSLASIPLEKELCAIPNTVAMVQGAPHSEWAMSFIHYMQNENVLSEMVKASALISAELPTRDNDFLYIYWPEILAEKKESFTFLRDTFLR
ncbi:MAG: extracellular solute-binding protein [Verrucomicrobia bacterium]|nr:extracellular solute-binding protein [Verrucomicrobiota bacterium]